MRRGKRQALLKRGIARTPRDTDVLASYEEFASWVNPKACKDFYPIRAGSKLVAKKVTDNMLKIYECEVTWDNSLAKELHDLVCADSASFVENGIVYPSLDVLYTIKMSHRFLKNAPSFKKTMQDILLLRQAGATIPAKYADWYARRQAETYSYKHPNLNTSKESFFNGDQVPYVYDHDTIHEAIKLGDKPAYLYFKKPGADVACDKDLFNQQSDAIKLNSVLEESYVLALERSQIPNNFEIDALRSFEIALEKVCTSITSGWWRDYAWEHYLEAYARFSPDYVSKFKKALEAGKIAPFKDSTYG